MALKIGLVGRDDAKGIGSMTLDYTKHLPIERHLIVQDKHPDKRTYACPYITKHGVAKHAEEFVRGLDAVIVFEKAYSSIFAAARKHGVRSIWQVNYEYFPVKVAVQPDVYLCTSSLNAEHVPYRNKVLLPHPVDLNYFKFRERTTATTFVHNAGTLGWNGANGTKEFLEAMEMVYRRDARFLIRSQKPLQVPRHPQVQVFIGRLERRADLFAEGDVLVMPHKFRAMSLPIDEAMACGMPVLTSDVEPFNQHCAFTFPVSDYDVVRGPHGSKRLISVARIDPEKLAWAMRQLTGSKIMLASRAARAYAESISWTKLGPKYLELCRG